MTNRLISSHSMSPPRTDKVPTKRLGRNKRAARGDAAASAGRDSGGVAAFKPSLVALMAISYALIGNLRHARQQQAVGREIGGVGARAPPRIDSVGDFCACGLDMWG